VRKRVILVVDGRGKSGKTHFGLTAPGPIAYIDMDQGSEGVMHKFLPDKEIYYTTFRGLEEEDADVWKANWEELKECYYAALRSDTVKSIVFDTGSELWEMARLARLGRLEKVPPERYGPLNREFKIMMGYAYNYDKNVILLHQLKPEYIDRNRTGNYIRSGWSGMEFHSQANCTLLRDGNEFTVRIDDCRLNPDLNGMELSGEMCGFPYVAQLLFPDTDVEDWE